MKRGAFGLALLLSIPAGAEGADVLDMAEPWYGTQGVHWTLMSKGYQFLDRSEDWLENEPEKRTMILMGRMDRLQFTPNQLVDFVRRGGKVLTASDQKSAVPYFRAFGAKMIPKYVRGKNPKNCFQEQEDCPLIPTPNSGPFAGLKPIETNLPAYISTTRLKRRLVYGKDTSAPGQAFAVGEQLGKGKVFLIADHSPFINMMFSAHANMPFLFRVIGWLDQGGERTTTIGFSWNSVPVYRPLDIPPIYMDDIPEEDWWEAFNSFLTHRRISQRVNELLQNVSTLPQSDRDARERLFLILGGATILWLAFRMLRTAPTRRSAQELFRNFHAH